MKGYSEHSMIRHCAACRQGKVEQVYISSKCGHSILLGTVNCYFTIKGYPKHSMIRSTLCTHVHKGKLNKCMY